MSDITVKQRMALYSAKVEAERAGDWATVRQLNHWWAVESFPHCYTPDEVEIAQKVMWAIWYGAETARQEHSRESAEEVSQALAAPLVRWV